MLYSVEKKSKMAWIYFGFSILISFLKIALVVTLIVAMIAVVDHFVNVLPRVNAAKTVPQEPLDGRGFSTKKLPANIDAIVIGSGIGGLTTASLLARRGLKILVLEQHDKLGGCTHSFEEKGFEFDCGLHYVGGEVGNNKSQIGFIFDLLSGGLLKWSPLDSCYDIAAISTVLSKQSACSKDAPTPENLRRLDFIDQPEKMIKSIKELYPGEEEGVTQFFRLVKWAHLSTGIYMALKVLPSIVGTLLRKTLGWLLFDPFMKTSTKDVIDSCVKDPSLRGMLAWCWGDYGTPPAQSPFFVHASLVDHFSSGAFYPVGGPSEIANTFIRIIEAVGGKLFVRAPVSRIILSADGCSAIGVTVKGNDIYAPIIISAAGILNTYTRLLPADSEVPCDVANRARACLDLSPTSDIVKEKTPGSPDESLHVPTKLEPSCAMISVFLGLEGSPEELKIASSNRWMYPNWQHDLGASRYAHSTTVVDDMSSSGKVQDVFVPVVFMGSASAKDPSWSKRHPGKSVFELLTVADFDQFDSLRSGSDRSMTPTHRGKKYDTAKELLTNRLIEVFHEQYPELKDKVVHVSTGTPVTNNFYIHSVRGEVYGLSHTVTRYSGKYEWLLRPEQPIHGLFLSGQDVFCDGICGGLAGGILAAVAVDWTVIIDIVTSFIMAC